MGRFEAPMRIFGEFSGLVWRVVMAAAGRLLAILAALWSAGCAPLSDRGKRRANAMTAVGFATVQSAEIDLEAIDAARESLERLEYRYEELRRRVLQLERIRLTSRPGGEEIGEAEALERLSELERRVEALTGQDDD